MKLKVHLNIMLFFSCLVLQAQEADVMKSDAIMMEGQQQYLKAAELYEKAAIKYESMEKTDAFVLFKAGQNYNRVKQFDKALPLLLKAKENKYTEVELYLSLGDSYMGSKNYKEAEQILLEGKDIDKNLEVDFIKKLSYTYLHSKQYDKAISLLTSSLEEYSQNHTLWYLLGSSYERNKNYHESCDALKKVLELKPNDKKSIKKLGVILFRLTDSKYKKETKRYESLKNPSRVDYHNSTKKLEAISQEYKTALPYLEKAHANSPTDKAIISCLSVAYKRLKMNDKANAMKLLLE